MEELEAVKKSLSEVIKVVEKIAKKVEQIEKQAQRSQKGNGGYVLELRGNILKFKPSGYNNGSAMFVIEKPKKKQSITIALTKEDWEALKKLGDSYFYGDNSNDGSYNSKKSNGRSYSKKNYSKKSYGSKKSYKGYRKGKQAEEELEIEEASYDQALE